MIGAGSASSDPLPKRNKMVYNGADTSVGG